MNMDYNHYVDYNYKIVPSSPKKQKWAKDEDAFSSREGICYKDSNGQEYTYWDLMAYMRSAEGTKQLYEALHGRAPGKELRANNWNFWQCKRCGTWHYSPLRLKEGKDRTICEFCTPLRTDGKIRLIKDPYEDDRTFYKGRHTSFHAGLTTITGCNGIGKSTLLKNIADELKDRGTPHFIFDNLGESGGQKRVYQMLGNALIGRDGAEEFFAGINLLSLSEGEKIISSLNMFMSRIVTAAVTAADKTVVGYGELWLLFDAVDSGLSADFIEDFKDMLRKFYKDITQAHPLMQVFILMTSNSYETCHGTDVYSVAKNKYISIRTYEAFVKETRTSRKYKGQRDHVFELKEEIAKRPYVFTCEKTLLKDRSYRLGEKKAVYPASMELENFRLVVHAGDHRNGLSLYHKGEEGKYTKITCRDADIDIRGPVEKIEREMHEYLCERVYKEEKRKK